MMQPIEAANKAGALKLKFAQDPHLSGGVFAYRLERYRESQVSWISAQFDKSVAVLGASAEI